MGARFVVGEDTPTLLIAVMMADDVDDVLRTQQAENNKSMIRFRTGTVVL